MVDYDLNKLLSPLDFELLSKDLIEAEIGIRLENFREGRDRGIDLRYAPARRPRRGKRRSEQQRENDDSEELIVQCKRYGAFSALKSELKKDELPKIVKLNPRRYLLCTSVSLSPQQADEIKAELSPFIQSTDDIYGRDRLNSLLTKHPEVERRHIKLWAGSAGVLDSIVNSRTHVVSLEEVERTIAASKIYVRNDSFGEALEILKRHRVCIVSGQPGIGKTTLARMLLLYYLRAGFDIVKIESDISEARQVGYHNNPRFYFYDDFLGQTALADKLNKNEDQQLLDFMTSIRESKDSVFVLTTREYVLNQAKLTYEKLARGNFDHRKCTIDLSKYSRRNRAEILYNHIHFSDLPRPLVQSLVAKRGYVQLVDHQNYNPRLIEYMTSRARVGGVSAADYPALFLWNLDNPTMIWDHAFHNQISQRSRDLLHILVTIPMDCLMANAEDAFLPFHRSMCVDYGMSNSPGDFRKALSELDGTFIALRNYHGAIRIGFENPSIRDYMHNVLLNGDLLPAIIATLVYFEQAQWLFETLSEKKPRVSIQALARHLSSIVASLQRLYEAPSCALSLHWNQSEVVPGPRTPNYIDRLVVVARALACLGNSSNDEWIASKMSELAADIDEGRLSPSSCVESLGSLHELGHLASRSGVHLVNSVKRIALTEYSGLDDFETLSILSDNVPQSLTAGELEDVRSLFSGFIDTFPSDCDLTDPSELRNAASRIDRVGELLRVNTAAAQDALEKAADEIERDQTDWDDDDQEYKDGPSQVTDQELDSMFSTLGS